MPPHNTPVNGPLEKRRAAGAFLLRNGEILLAKRAPNRTLHPNVWDIVGGHCIAAEDPESALARELQEELGITPESVTKLAVLHEPREAEYGPAEYHVFLVSSWVGGEPVAHGVEHTELRWLRPVQALELELAHPGYRGILRQIQALEGNVPARGI